MLSIIIPTLNEENYLPFLLKSIKKQDFRDEYEIIVADAGSQDKTIEIAKNHGCRIVKGGTPAKGRNEGAKTARGNLFLFLDADVLLLSPAFLTNVLEDFKKRNLDIAAFPIVCVEGNIIDRLVYKFYNWFIKNTQDFLPHASNAILADRKIHEKILGFAEDVKIAEDHNYVRRTAKCGKFGIIGVEPIITSVRRYRRDGRFKTYFKYFICELYMIFLGPVKSDILKYRFNHYLQKSKDKL